MVLPQAGKSWNNKKHKMRFLEAFLKQVPFQIHSTNCNGRYRCRHRRHHHEHDGHDYHQDSRHNPNRYRAYIMAVWHMACRYTMPIYQ